MKRTFAWLLALAMMLSALTVAAAERTDCEVRPTPVWSDGEIGSFDLRFYPDAPHVAYYGMKAYLDFMMGVELTVAGEDGGAFRVTRPEGFSILVDPRAGTIVAEDWASFQAPPLPFEGWCIGVKDTTCAWSRYDELVYDDAPQRMTFDFAKYGIPVYADAEDVYLPLALLSTMFSDIAYNHVLYNGEKVFRPQLDVNALTGLPEGYYESPRMRALLTGEAEREEDAIREDYAELCFIMDYFFGHPGTALLDEAIGEVGLDAALSQMPDGQGDAIRESLHSPDMAEYLIGLSELFGYGLDDGHTMFTGVNGLLSEDMPYPQLRDKIFDRVYDTLERSKSMRMFSTTELVKVTRSEIWGDDVYRECGSTAILRIDDFLSDDDGWTAYFAGTGEMPMDALGITWSGLQRASENPAIKNILFDLTANGGGCNDELSAMVDLTIGDDQFRGINVLTGQKVHAVIRTDKNMDGSIDGKDEDVAFNFRYGVLTSRGAFSCGNLFPFLMQEHGAVLIGEPTSGGSCCVAPGVLSSGAVFMYSSALWRLETRDGAFVEGGCRTDIPIVRQGPEDKTSQDLTDYLFVYADYFSDEALDRMMNEWFDGAEG